MSISQWLDRSVSTNVANTPTVYFITGATGLMAAEFLARVLEKDEHALCIVLVRATTLEKADERVSKLLDFLFPSPGDHCTFRSRVHSVLGDISRPNLGMSDADRQAVVKHTQYILHAAALTDWSADLDTAMRVNVDGVKEMIALAKECGSKLERFLHISTAYLSGAVTGRLQPDDLHEDVPPCDNYQQSKRLGEHWVRQNMSDLPITIVRPTTVVGNSINGRTQTYKTFYYPLHILYNGLPLVLPVAKRGHLEAVSSDWAAKIMYELIRDNSCISQCYHLSNGEKVNTNGQIRAIVYRVFHSIKEQPKRTVYIPFFIYKLFIAPKLIRSLPNGEDLDSKLRLYRHYMTYRRIFDNTSTQAISEKYGIEQPKFESYLETLLNYAVKNKWEKKRKTIRRAQERAKNRLATRAS